MSEAPIAEPIATGVTEHSSDAKSMSEAPIAEPIATNMIFCKSHVMSEAPIAEPIATNDLKNNRRAAR